jgi:peptidyl-prolyl cis-trans isomerase B (cyclophilin B)
LGCFYQEKPDHDLIQNLLVMKKNLYVGFVFLFFVFSCGSKSSNQESDQQQPVDLSTKEVRTKVLITTDLGDITIELFNETPLHRDNFIKLVNEGFYDGTIFHRVIQDFMIQGGDPDSRNAEPGVPLGMGGPGYTLPAEFVQGLFHEKGVLSAARMGDQVNPQKESSGSQFYIVQGKVYTPQELDLIEQRTGKLLSNEQRNIYTTIGGTPHLDNDYTVFGQVVEGLDVVDKITAVEKDRRDRPIEDIKMTMKVVQ